MGPLDGPDRVAIEVDDEVGHVDVAVAAVLQAVHVVPALGREGVRHHGRAKQEAHLAARHAHGDLVHEFLAQQVSLLDVRSVHAARGQGDRHQQQCQRERAGPVDAGFRRVHLSGVTGTGRT